MPVRCHCGASTPDLTAYRRHQRLFHRPRNTSARPFLGLTVAQGAAASIRRMKSWLPVKNSHQRAFRTWDDVLRYCCAAARGDYPGYSALHDIVDANMLTPFADTICAMSERTRDRWTAWANAVTDEAHRRIMAECRRKGFLKARVR